MTIFCFILTMLLLICFFIFFPMVEDYKKHSEQSKDGIGMKYKEFKDIFWVNEERWRYAENCSHNIIMVIYSAGKDGNVPARFNFIDFLRVRKFFSDLKKDEENRMRAKKQKERLQSFSRCVQQDIDQIRQQKQEELDKAQEMTRQVKDNLFYLYVEKGGERRYVEQ